MAGSGMSRRRFLRTAGAGVAAIGAGVAYGKPPAGIGGGPVTIRPLDDWLVHNPPTFNWTTPESELGVDGGYYVAIHYDPAQWCGYPPSEPDTPWCEEGRGQYDGYVLERVLNDGRVELTVNVTARNAPLTVYRFVDGIIGVYGPLYCDPDIPLPEPILGAGTDGSIDYFFMEKHIMPDSFSPGDEIPYLGTDAPPEGAQTTFIHFAGTGRATFTAHAGESVYSDGTQYGVFKDCVEGIMGVDITGMRLERFTPFAKARVTISQVGLYAVAERILSRYEEPEDYKGALADAYPAEVIDIQEVG